MDMQNLPKEALFNLLLQIEPKEIKIVCLSRNSKVREICNSEYFQEAYNNKYPKKNFFNAEFSAKLSRLPPRKVLDVSNLHHDGTGAFVIFVPSARSKKVVVGNIASDSLLGVQTAARLLGDENLVQLWKAVRETKN